MSNEKTQPGEKKVVRQYGRGNPLMELAFRDFVFFAWSDPEFRADFEKSTGMCLSLPRSPLESMIDKATVRLNSTLAAFVEWVIKEHWGVEGQVERVAE